MSTTTNKSFFTLYICLESIGLLLIIPSIIILLHPRTKPFLTKRTLRQYFLASFFERIFRIPLIVIYNTLTPKTPGTLCIFQAHLSNLLSYPLQMIPAALTFYLWFAVARNKNMEKVLYSWLTSIIWIVAVVGSLAQLFSLSNDDYWGVKIKDDGCDLGPSNYRLFQIIPTVTFAVIGLGFAVASVYAFCSIWLRQIERTVLGYWYSLSLASACLLVTVINVSNSTAAAYNVMIANSYQLPIFLLHLKAILGPLLYTIFVICEYDNTPLHRWCKCGENYEEDDEDSNDTVILSWPSSNTLTEPRFTTSTMFGKPDMMERGRVTAADSGVFPG
ncbi:12036_t:CDS:2 [Ambispora leptoticha]|uniref:12036_t:CDS:1 n=1 Tax=Ambispora leptoticha TaxID=144679 RepID=A0A9N9C8G7_9GLOM|nr:12036_t:CDS:2 [Ambispora leptoticha]